MKRVQVSVCILIAVVVALMLTISGAAFLRIQAPGKWHRVVPLTSIPDDGVPRLFSVLDHPDGWNVNPGRSISQVYLIREPGSSDVRAFLAHCQRGAFVFYDADKKVFRSNCWDLLFDLHGKPLREIDRAFSEDIIAVEIVVEREHVWIHLTVP